MDEHISYFIRNLQHSHWRVKSRAYADLMNFMEPRAVSLFWDAIDPKEELLLIYFCRWISKNILLEGIPYLIRLIDNGYIRASKEAMFSLENIIRNSTVPEKVKIGFLMDMLLHGKEETQLFAARMCAKYRKKAGGPYLIGVLRQSASAKVRVACVDALRENQDERALPQLKKALADPDINVLYAVIFALGDLGEPGAHWKVLVPFLKESRVTLRHVSIWAIGRLGGKKAFSALAECLKTDPSPVCRMEACKRISKLLTPRIIPVLLEAASLDKDQNVKNMARFCLDKIPPSLAFKKYYRLRKSRQPNTRIEVFIQLAKIRHPKAFRYLTSVLTKEKNPQIQAAAAEALGTLEDRRAIPILKEALSLHPVIAYSAMVSLAQLMGSQEIPFILEILKNEKTPPMTQQIILKHLLAKGKDKKIFFTQQLIDVLIPKLHAADINISYLAAMTLGESHDLSAIVPLFQLSLMTQDPEVRMRSLKAVEDLLEGNVSMLVKLLTQKFMTPPLYEEILKSLSRFKCKIHYKRDALMRLLVLMEGALDRYRVYFLSAVCAIIGEDLDIFLNILKQTTWSASLTLSLFELVEGLINEGDAKNALLSLDAFQRGLKHSDAALRKVSARILEKISQTSALEDLVGLVYGDHDTQVSRYAKVAVRTLVNEVR